MDRNKSILKQLQRVRGIRNRTIQEATGLSQPTVDKRLMNPKLMNGIDRKSFSTALGISVELMDDIINGRVRTIFNVMERSRNEKQSIEYRHETEATEV